MGTDNFEAELKSKVEYIEGVIKKMLPKEEGYAKTVIEAMNYSLMAGGKRLRPMMMHEAYTLFAGDRASDAVIQPFMTAMEMIHTYSLVHDDLPAMDNDEYRRGRKTTHVVYGPGMATLAGDGLLNLAFVARLPFDLEVVGIDTTLQIGIAFLEVGVGGGAVGAEVGEGERRATGLSPRPPYKGGSRMY